VAWAAQRRSANALRVKRTRGPSGSKAVWGPPRRVRLGCIGMPAGPRPGSTPAAGNNPNPSQAWGGVTELRCLVCGVITDCGPKGLAYATLSDAAARTPTLGVEMRLEAREQRGEKRGEINRKPSPASFHRLPSRRFFMGRLGRGVWRMGLRSAVTATSGVQG